MGFNVYVWHRFIDKLDGKQGYAGATVVNIPSLRDMMFLARCYTKLCLHFLRCLKIKVTILCEFRKRYSMETY